MRHYPDPKRLREISVKEGVSKADQLLQDAMINSARNKIEKNLVNLEDSGRFETTGYGQKWIADNVEHLADSILEHPTAEVVFSFINFPRKLKLSAPESSLSAVDYLKDVRRYRAQGIKQIDKEGDAQQEKINEFVSACYFARKRAQVVALIVLSRVLEHSLGIKRSKSSIDEISSTKNGKRKYSKSLTNMAGKIMDEVLLQLLEDNKKDLKKVCKRVTVNHIKNEASLILKNGRVTNLGKKVSNILGIKNPKSVTNEQLLKEGHVLLKLVNSVISDILISEGEIEIRKEVAEDLMEDREGILERACEMRPVLEKPLSDGRFVSYREDIMSDYLLDCQDKNSYLSLLDVKAAQMIQSVPFRINKKLLEAIKLVVKEGLEIKDKLNVAVPDKIAPLEGFPVFDKSMTKDVFLKKKEAWFSNKNNKEAYFKWAKLRNKRGKEIAKAISINDMNKMTLEIAQWYADYGGSFYLPVYFDYRTRCYYCPTILNPQASKLAKALFISAKSEEITESGMDYWLVNLAGSMKEVKDPEGHKYVGDKSPWDVALYAAKNELSKAATCACDVVDTFDYWSDMEEPFTYLSHCFESSRVIESGHKAFSNIFLSMDGSCNGYQHAAAYLQDNSTANLVNMSNYSPLLVPKDLYGNVSDCINRRAKVDRGTLNQKLLNCSFVTRKSVKRITMCIGYSLTENGALVYSDDEILKMSGEDGKNPLFKNEEELEEISNFFRDGIFNSIREVAPAIFRSRDVVRETAKIMCSLGNGVVSMETTTGTRVNFTKHIERTKRIHFRFAGNKCVFNIKKIDKNSVEKREVANASSPNFTHMNDATHLRMVALEMPEDAPLLFIHDSFGTTAKYAAKMAQVTRETFRDMYEAGDVLQNFVILNLENICNKFNIDIKRILKTCEKIETKGLDGNIKFLARSINKIVENIKPTKDLDWDKFMSNRNFFR